MIERSYTDNSRIGCSPTGSWYADELYAGLCDGMRPLRVIHVCKYFPPERGGMESYVQTLALAQAAGGHQVLVLAHGTAASGRETLAENCTVSRSRVWLRLGAYLPVAPKLLWNLWRAVRGFAPHIVHVHCPNPAALWCVALLRGKSSPHGARHPALVVHWHADVVFPQDRQPNAWLLAWWRRMERALLARADRIIATSQPYLDSSAYIAPWRAKCVVVPLRIPEPCPQTLARHPAVDFLRDPVAGTTRAVLSVGRLAHYKGFEVLVRAIAQAPHVRCCIVGTGEQGPTLRVLVLALGLEGRVLLAGEVDDDVLQACYAACDVFCLPSLLRTEAFGLVLLEALQAGKWCVASDVPGCGMGTVLRHGINGWLVPPGDVQSLAAALESGQTTLVRRLACPESEESICKPL